MILSSHPSTTRSGPGGGSAAKPVPTPATPSVLTCVLDTRGYVERMSGSALESFGVTSAQLVGAPLTSIVKDDERTRLESAIAAALAGSTEAIFAELEHPSPMHSAVLISLAPMIVEGEITGIHVLISIASDATELSLRHQHTHRMELVGRLATGLAHDLNNRLLVIAGRSRFALDELPHTSPVRAHLEEVGTAASRAASLTRQLLALGRPRPTSAQWTNLNDILTGMDTLLSRLIDESITLRLRLDPALWRVLVDQGQIEQMILNLVLNAKDAMPDGGELAIETRNVRVPSDELRVPAELPDGDFIRLAIRDTGRGMDTATLLRAFDPFFTTQNMAERSGLGLTSVYAIVQHARGVLDVDSAPGGGTTFGVYLPRAISAPAVAPSRTPTAPGARTTAGPNSRVILVVDDEASVRSLVRLVLQERGFHVLEARSGSESLLLAEIQRNPVDLLISDLAMPEMNGVELSERMREHFPTIRVLFMSGYTEEGLLSRETLPADKQFIQKPFALATLLDAVHGLLGTEHTQ